MISEDIKLAIQSSMGELGLQLARDKSGLIFAEYRDMFERMIAQGSEKMRQSLTAEEFVSVQSIVQAGQLAIELLDDLWYALHER
jgi:hypothetical protein